MTADAYQPTSGATPVSNVSDTARWVAAYRATESARPDSVFQDPLAERLAGDQGRAIAARFPRTVRSGWFLVALTKIIDDVILEAIAAVEIGHARGKVVIQVSG